jgi:hypothetical protein
MAAVTPAATVMTMAPTVTMTQQALTGTIS